MFQTYPPANRDKTIGKFIAASILIWILALLIAAVFHKHAARISMMLIFIALGLLIAGPIVKWWRWSRDPGFREFLAAKKAQMRKDGYS